MWSEGIEPSSPAWHTGILAVWTTTTQLRCQGGARTPVFRVTAGRLAARPPGTDFDRMGTATGIRTPASGLRARCLDLSTIAAWGPRWDSHPRPRPYQGRALPPELQGRGLAVPIGRRRERRLLRRAGKAGLAGTIRTCDPRLRKAVLCSAELRRVGVDGRSRTCNLRIRKPVPCPFGHVDERATDGTRTRDLRLDRPALQLTELRRLGTRPGPRTQSVPG